MPACADHIFRRVSEPSERGSFLTEDNMSKKTKTAILIAEVEYMEPLTAEWIRAKLAKPGRVWFSMLDENGIDIKQSAVLVIDQTKSSKSPRSKRKP